MYGDTQSQPETMFLIQALRSLLALFRFANLDLPSDKASSFARQGQSHGEGASLSNDTVDGDIATVGFD
jgi:hypothetical protein